MKKLLRKVLVGFGILSVMAILGNTVFSGGDKKAQAAQAPVAATSTAAAPAAASPVIKNSVLLFHYVEGGQLVGLLFEDGTSIAVNSQNGAYQRLDTNKTGRCFAFTYGDNFEDQKRTDAFELQPGMVLYIEYYYGLGLLALREHPMKGLPIIILPAIWGGPFKVTIDSDGKSTDFSFSTTFGKDKIAKIPETGAQSIVFTGSKGNTFTVTNDFDRPVPVKVTEPYSFVGFKEPGWIIKAPVLQKTGITLSEGQVKAIMSIGK